ncbi:GL21117 [Drosophila persimilis]|uniref:GL21117 n=1 Tax=Drosophila persimilis TaxID=7234 RepID=B4GXF7_DROPE|nr:GL21117 [Drosophila persimilis]
MGCGILMVAGQEVWDGAEADVSRCLTTYGTASLLATPRGYEYFHAAVHEMKTMSAIQRTEVGVDVDVEAEAAPETGLRHKVHKFMMTNWSLDQYHYQYQYQCQSRPRPGPGPGHGLGHHSQSPKPSLTQIRQCLRHKCHRVA